jgi:hypothetical protein
MATLGFYVFFFFFNVFFKGIFFIRRTLIIFCSLKRERERERGDIVQIESLEIHCQLSGSLRGVRRLCPMIYFHIL